MSKITSVEPQKRSASRRTKRFNVFLDGEFAFGVDEDLVVNRRLVIGKIIAPEELDQILFEAEVGKLMERIYRLWSIRQRSEKEVRDYFKIKNLKLKIKKEEPISNLVIDAMIDILKRKSLLNDLEFAKAWVEARRKSKQKGVRAIKLELFQKGIDKEIIEEVLSKPFDFAQDEEELARQALEKKMRIWKNLDSRKLRQKATEFLLRRGFEYEVVKEVVEKMLEKG